MFTVVHQFPRHVVDRSNMVGINGVPQPEGVGQKSSPKQDRLVAEGQKGPGPCSDVDAPEKAVNTCSPFPETSREKSVHTLTPLKREGMPGSLSTREYLLRDDLR